MPEAFCRCPRPAAQVKRHGAGYRINAIPEDFLAQGRRCLSCGTAYSMAAPVLA